MKHVVRWIKLSVLGLWLALMLAPTPQAALAAPAAPYITGPDDNAQLTTFSPALTWGNPGGASQYQVQVTPLTGDGPSLDVYVPTIGNSFQILSPPRWYGLLPDMTYIWRVRVSDAAGLVTPDDASWGPWAQHRFRTPPASSDTIQPLSPAEDEVVTTLTPTLQWDNTQREVFYYEVQLSSDPAFGAGPAGPIAPVYSTLIHGGITHPQNSYAVPFRQYLQDGVTYSWRVRPRIQGDGTPVAWTQPMHFTTQAVANVPMLSVQPIGFGTDTVSETDCGVVNPGVSFPSSPTLTGVYYTYQYSGAGRVVHRWYANGRPVDVASFDLTSDSNCWDARFTLSHDLPASAGTFELEVWHAGRLAQSALFTVTPAKQLEIGPITAGTSISRGACSVGDTGTTFPAGTTTVFFRWNTVGTGNYYLNLYKNGMPVLKPPNYVEEGPVGCGAGSYSHFTPGTWRLIVYYGRQQQSITITIR